MRCPNWSSLYPVSISKFSDQIGLSPGSCNNRGSQDARQRVDGEAGFQEELDIFLKVAWALM